MNCPFCHNVSLAGGLKIFNAILGFLLVVIISILAVLSAAWLTEPDPLHITTVEDEPDVVHCTNGSFSFKRYTRTDKYLDVKVSPKMVNLNDPSIVYELPMKNYSGNARDMVTTYRQDLPANFPPGEYEYIPTLTYDINVLQRNFSKVGPTQKVTVDCVKPEPMKRD